MWVLIVMMSLVMIVMLNVGVIVMMPLVMIVMLGVGVLVMMPLVMIVSGCHHGFMMVQKSKADNTLSTSQPVP